MRAGTPTPFGNGHMRERGQISTFQFTAMLVSTIVSFSAALVPAQILQIAKADAWLSIIGAWSLDVVLAVVYAYMGLRFPGQTFVQYAIVVLGPWFGRLAGLLFTTFFYFSAAMLLHGFATMVAGIFLPGTPVAITTLAAATVIAYGARGGLEVIARAAEILGPFFVMAILGIVAADYRFGKLAHLSPVLEHGLMPVMAAVPMTLSFVAICIVMGMFQAYHNEPHQTWFAKFAAVSVGSILLIAIVVTSVAIFGPEAAGAARFPDLALARLVSVGEFVERVEAIWVVIAVGAAVLGTSVLLWAAALGLAQTLGLKEYKPLVYPLAGLLVPLSLMLFSNQMEQSGFSRYIFPFYALTIEAILELVIWLVALLTGKRGQGQSPGRVQEPERPTV